MKSGLNNFTLCANKLHLIVLTGEKQQSPVSHSLCRTHEISFQSFTHKSALLYRIQEATDKSHVVQVDENGVWLKLEVLLRCLQGTSMCNSLILCNEKDLSHFSLRTRCLMMKIIVKFYLERNPLQKQEIHFFGVCKLQSKMSLDTRMVLQGLPGAFSSPG